MPTAGGKVITKFGAPNTCEDKVDYSENGAHAAVDIAQPDSFMIYAVYDGVIVEARNAGTNGGYRITIEHTVESEKFYSYYFHLQEFDTTDVINTYVDSGTVIGQMGDTGSNPGSIHLHFEVRTQTGYEAGRYDGRLSFWANGSDELHNNWVDISSRFGGYCAELPKDWYYSPN